jgi:hypothetical protein
MTNPQNTYPIAQEAHPNRAIILETSLGQWHERMEGVMAQGARVIAFRGAGSANGIEPTAATHIGEMLHRYVTDLTADGTPVVLMYDGDDDVRERPDLGSVFGALVDGLADNASVTAMAVQTTGWYKPRSEGAALASAGGRAYETYVFNKDMPEIDPSLKGRGLAHSALTQSGALVAYGNYEQIIVGAAGSITAGQLHDLAQKTEGRPAEAGPVRVSILSAHINPELDESLQDSAQNDPREDRRTRAAEKIVQRTNHPYGALFTAAGEFALVAADYPGVDFQPTVVQ